MNYDFIAIPDEEVPKATNPLFQHVITTYASETNKTASMWRAVPDEYLDFKPHEKTNTIRTIMVHQILSERRFFAQFVGTQEPPAEELLPPGDKPPVQAYIDKFVWLAKLRLPQLAAGTEAWWLTPTPFFGGLQRERIWIFWRRVLPRSPRTAPRFRSHAAVPPSTCTARASGPRGSRPDMLQQRR
jgi:hypothetical protein